MTIVELLALFVEASATILTDLAKRRLNQAVDIFRAVKKAVELWDKHKDEIEGTTGEYYKGVAETVVESVPKINKLRNLTHLSVDEYKALVSILSAQQVLDLGQDSRLSNDIKDYKVGTIVKAVAKFNSECDYSLKQDDTESFMGLLKGSIKDDTLNVLLGHFESLNNMCKLLAEGELFGNPYFAKPEDKPEDSEDEGEGEGESEGEDEGEETKPEEKIALSEHKRILDEAQKAHDQVTASLRESVANLQEQLAEAKATIDGITAKLAEETGKVRSLTKENNTLRTKLDNVKASPNIYSLTTADPNNIG